MKVWTVANQKGGVGKTTTTVTLGGLLASKGQRVLLIDLDPHGSLSSYLGIEDSEERPGTYQLFAEGKKLTKKTVIHQIRETDFEHLYVMPASLPLSTLDRYIGKKNKIGLVIKNAIDMIRNDFDFIIIDCPPVVGVLMINALAACDSLIIPVQTEFLALKGLERMIETIQMVVHSKGINVDYLILPTMYDQRTKASQEALSLIRDKYQQHVWNGYIPIDTKFRDSSQQGIPLTRYAPSSKGAWAYQQLLKNLIQRVVLHDSISVVNDE